MEEVKSGSAEAAASSWSLEVTPTKAIVFSLLLLAAIVGWAGYRSERFTDFAVRTATELSADLSCPTLGCDDCAELNSPPRYLRGYVSYVIFNQRWVDIQGAFRFARTIPKIFPGAKFLLYYDNTSSNQTLISALKTMKDVKLISFTPQSLIDDGWNLTTQAYRVVRYFALDLPTDEWDYILFRDLDSIINIREKAAVDEWLRDPDCLFHSMRDHPAHWWHFMGGMWGVKRKGLEKIPFNFTEELKNFTRKDNNGGTDQIFLQDVLWPYVRDYTMAHDAYYCNETSYPRLKSRVHWGFPTAREEKQIVANFARISELAQYVGHDLYPVPMECRRRPRWTYG